MSTLLIIGGSGFFGKSFLDSFCRGNLDKWGIEKVIAASRNASRLERECPHLLGERVELMNLDVCTTDWLPRADYVIHAAASTDSQSYVAHPNKEGDNMRAGIINYCRLAPLFHAYSKILYVSSGAVYGKQPVNIKFIEESYDFLNNLQINEGKKEYTVAKREAEINFSKLNEVGIKTAIARCFAFVGPWLPRDRHFAIGNLINQAITKNNLVINAVNPVIRSYMHADDLVNWLMTIMENSSLACPVYNVGSEDAVSLVELSEKIAAMYNLKSESKVNEQLQEDRYIPSTKKARTALGLELSVNLDDAISLTIGEICKKRF